jgi:uncharacterized protein YheU (UPF0270 family)
MARVVRVPPALLAAPTLEALLQEYASRDGTDYGMVEIELAEKVSRLRQQLDTGELQLLYDEDSEQWDLVAAPDAQQWLAGGE